MKHILATRFALALLLILAGTALPVSTASAEPLRVMTFNIRYGTAPDGDNAWPLRRELALQVIRDCEPHLVGLQEALREQLDEIVAALPHYVAVGVGREADGSGEYSALLVDRRRLDLFSSDTHWLSDTPQVRGSRTWGNDYPRLVTAARLVDRTSGQTLRVLNTHWDHQSQPARIGSGQQLAAQLGTFPADEPVIVMGDFNIGPDNEARQPLAAAGLRESYFLQHPGGEQVGTFHGFQGTTTGDKIDAILVNAPWQVLDAQILHTNRAGHYPSDHFPVTATLALPPAE